MTGILSIKPEDEKILHPEALKWFNDRRAEIQFEVPLEELSDDDFNTFLTDDEKRKFQSCMKEISKGLAICMNIGDGASPDPLTNASIGLSLLQFQVNSLLPMRSIKLLLKKVYECKVAKAKEEQRKREEEEKRKAEEAREEERKQQEKVEAERREKEDSERWCAAYIAIQPPMDDAKKYLNDEEYEKFEQSSWEAIEVYMGKREDYLNDTGTFGYRGWLWKINYKKEEERQKIVANIAAREFNNSLSKHIAGLKSKLTNKPRDLQSYFTSKIQDKRYTGHNFDYVLDDEQERVFDATLVRVANDKLKQIIPPDLLEFIEIPSTYYRIYFPLPSISYSFEGIPCLDFSFEIFVAAYGKVWLKPGKKRFGDYEFHLSTREKNANPVPLQEPEFLGYFYTLLTPEDLDGYVLWETIPLVLLNWLLEGGTKPPGITISAASDDSTTYKIPKFKEEVDIPDKFADYLKNIGNFDGMLNMGIMNEKVGSVIRSLDGQKPESSEELKTLKSKKEKAFQLFTQGFTPSSPEIKALGLNYKVCRNYYALWKKEHKS